MFWVLLTTLLSLTTALQWTDSFTLLEARQKEMEARFEAKQQNMLTLMSTENARLQAELDSVKKENNRQNDYISAFQNTTKSLKARLDAASTRVSFHARLTSTLDNFVGILHPFNIITNEGDALNGTTGIFTTPRNGTYFFVASSSTQSPDKYVYMHLVKEGTSVALAYARQ